MAYLSIVTTLYDSEKYIDEFYRRTVQVVTKITDDYEIIFVNDGSSDNSMELAKAIINKDKKVRLIELSRNFGHHKAVMVGLEHAKGNFVFLIDCDLEEKPELLTAFYKVMCDNLDGIDVVYGYMSYRKGDFWEKITGQVFYKIINFMSDVHIPEDVLMARLMKKTYVQNLLRFQETHVFIGGLLQLSGYNQVGIPVIKTSKGTTSYNLLKRLSQATDAIVSFTMVPLIYISILGLVMSFFSFCYAAYIIINKILYGQVLVGWTSVMASIWFIGGVIITSIGVIGIYIGKIFIQVKKRPNVIIKNIYN